jgi:hypothetical protein
MPRSLIRRIQTQEHKAAAQHKVLQLAKVQLGRGSKLGSDTIYEILVGLSPNAESANMFGHQ